MNIVENIIYIYTMSYKYTTYANSFFFCSFTNCTFGPCFGVLVIFYEWRTWCCLLTSDITYQDGPQAGQTVPHVHIHVIPRKKGDFEKNDEIYDAVRGIIDVHIWLFYYDTWSNKAYPFPWYSRLMWKRKNWRTSLTWTLRGKIEAWKKWLMRPMSTVLFSPRINS